MRITFAGNEILVPRETGVDLNTNLGSANARTAAAKLEYTVSGVFFTVDTIQVDDMYTEMLRQRLTQEESVSILYKEYYSFSLDNITSGSHTTRFSLSSSSIDKMYATFRDSNAKFVGIRGNEMPDAAFTDNGVANAFRFMSFDSTSSRAGSMRYVWSVNNVRTPQYQADVRDALFDLAYTNNKVYDDSSGTLVTAMSQFHQGLFVIPLILNHPGESQLRFAQGTIRAVSTRL